MAQVGDGELADAFQIADIARGGELAVVGMHRLAGREIGRHVGDVVAVVGRFGRAVASPGFQALQGACTVGASVAICTPASL